MKFGDGITKLTCRRGCHTMTTNASDLAQRIHDQAHIEDHCAQERAQGSPIRTRTRLLKMRCQLCGEEEAVRLCLWLDTGNDLPVGPRCLSATGMTGRPLPHVEDLTRAMVLADSI